MSTLKELLQQKAELEKAIEAAIKKSKADSVARVQALMVELDVSVSDLRGDLKATFPKASQRSKIAAKYRNIATGEAWSGRGLQPKWLKAALASGQTLEDFAVKPD